jgi:ribosomal protein L4
VTHRPHPVSVTPHARVMVRQVTGAARQNGGPATTAWGGRYHAIRRSRDHVHVIQRRVRTAAARMMASLQRLPPTSCQRGNAIPALREDTKSRGPEVVSQ